MLPTLHPGDEVLFRSDLSGDLDLSVGDIVLIHHPNYPNEILIKRIFQIRSENQIELRGDNLAESIDSRQFGWITRDQIVGKVTCLFSSNRS